MSELVDPAKIESLVGVPRHQFEHWGRFNTEEHTLYLMHSRDCTAVTTDLRTCSYSLAMDKWIDDETLDRFWEGCLDHPVRVIIYDGRLVPDVGSVI